MKQGCLYPRQTWTLGLSNAWKGGEEADPQKTVRAQHRERGAFQGGPQVKASPRDLTPGSQPRSPAQGHIRPSEAASGLRRVEERGRLTRREAG